MTTHAPAPPTATLRMIIRSSFLLGAIVILVGTLALPTLNLADVAAAERVFGAQAVQLQFCSLLITVDVCDAVATAVISRSSASRRRW